MTENIGKYHLDWNNNNWLNYGKWLAAPRTESQFKDEKILIRKITSTTLIAQYIPFTSYCNTLLFVLKLKSGLARISYKALLSILNSKFIGWYFKKKFQIDNADTFPQIMIRDILNISIPNEDNFISKNLEMKVDSILSLKTIKANLDTSDLESQIDQLVYQLYNLTPEEIKIVEGEV